MTLFIYGITFIFGLLMGSFLNVVSIRSYQGTAWWRGRSACPKCLAPIAWYDNIPLISFAFLRGSCRHCKTYISWQYPLVELATALVFVLLLSHYGLGVHLIMAMILISFLIIIFIQDLQHYAVLDQVVLPAIVFAVAMNIWLGVSVFSLIIGMALGAGFFALQYLVSKGKWVGDGDIRLGALMGAALGWQYTIVALMIAYIIGAVIGAFLLMMKRKEMSSAVPFGPFLMIALFITFLYGAEILRWYISLLYS